MHSRLAKHPKHLISIVGRRDHAQRDGNDLDAVNEVYKVELAVAVAPQMEEAAALLRVELKAFEIAKIALLSGNTLEFEPLTERGGELSLSASASGEERIHVVEIGRQ